jgi:hypothetical protein
MARVLLALFLAATTGDPKPPQDASEWLARARKKLTT